MPGPGGREVGRVSIRVVPDVSRFARDLEGKLARFERTLKLSIPAVIDASGIAEEARRASEVAQKAARDVKIDVKVDRRVLAQLKRDLGSLSGIKIPNFNKAIGIGALGITAAAAVPNVLALAGSLTQVAGVAALLPAMLGGAIAGIGTLVLGFQGVGDALKAMSDPKKVEQYQEALAKLAPSARDTVKAIKGLSPAFRDLRLDVQQKLFVGMADTLRKLAKSYLPGLKSGLGGIATASGSAFQWVALAARGKDVLADLRPTLASIAGAIGGFGNAIALLVPAFSEITKVGASFLPGLADGFADLAGRFNAFIARVSKSGQLADFIQGGLDAVKDLSSVLGSTARILGGLFKAAEAGGGSVLSTFADGLERVADLVNTPSFQKGLTAVFAGIQAAAKPILDALPAIADAFVALAPAIGDLAKAFGTGLGEALKTVAGVLVQMAPTINGWADALANLDPKLLGIITSVVVLAPIVGSLAGAAASAVKTLGALAPVLGILTGPVGLVVAGIAALVGGFLLLYQNSKPVRDATAGVMEALQGLWAALQPVISDLRDALIPLLPQVQETFRGIAGAVAQYMGFVEVVITRVTQAVSYIWEHWGTQITGLVTNAFRTVLGVISGAFGIIEGLFQTAASILNGDWSGAWEGIKKTVSSAWSIITTLVSGAIGQILALFGTSMDNLKKKAGEGWARIKTAVGEGVSKVVAVVSGLPGKVVTALGDFGSLLYKKGQSLIQGLIDGIKSKIKAVGEAAASVAQKVKDFFPGSPVKTGPLTSWNDGAAGQRLVEMLTDGMASMEGKVAASARELAATLNAGFDPELAVGAAGAGAGFGRGRGDITVQGNVGWSPEDLADAITEREEREDALFPVFGEGTP